MIRRLESYEHRFSPAVVPEVPKVEEVAPVQSTVIATNDEDAQVCSDKPSECALITPEAQDGIKRMMQSYRDMKDAYDEAQAENAEMRAQCKFNGHSV